MGCTCLSNHGKTPSSRQKAVARAANERIDRPRVSEKYLHEPERMNRTHVDENERTYFRNLIFKIKDKNAPVLDLERSSLYLRRTRSSLKIVDSED